MSRPTSRRPRIALLVDHPDRDLPGLVLTAVELCRQGAVCHLVPANLAWREIWALAPDFVLFNYLRRTNQALGARLVEAGIPFAALDTEGGVWPEPGSYAELLWTDASLRRQAAGLYCWGRRMADYLVAEGFFDRPQIALTGCPRFDFYHPSWRAVLAKDDSGKAPGPPQILVNTNFSTRNPRFATVEQKIATAKANIGWSESRIREILDIEERAILQFIEITRRLAREHPECRVLLRPHPFEDLAWYQRELSAYPNVLVDNQGPVQSVLFESALVVQRSCTTGIEAGLIGTPTLSPQWITPPYLMPTAEAVSVPCGDAAELATLTDAILAGRYTPPPDIAGAIQAMITEWFHAIDGESYRRVANAIMAAAPRRPVRASSFARQRLYLDDDAGVPLTGVRALGARLRIAARLSPDWSFHQARTVPRLGWARTRKYYDAERVRHLADACAQQLRGRGFTVPRIEACAARDRGDYLVGRFGHSITLTSNA